MDNFCPHLLSFTTVTDNFCYHLLSFTTVTDNFCPHLLSFTTVTDNFCPHLLSFTTVTDNFCLHLLSFTTVTDNFCLHLLSFTTVTDNYQNILALSPFFLRRSKLEILARSSVAPKNRREQCSKFVGDVFCCRFMSRTFSIHEIAAIL